MSSIHLRIALAVNGPEYARQNRSSCNTRMHKGIRVLIALITLLRACPLSDGAADRMSRLCWRYALYHSLLAPSSSQSGAGGSLNTTEASRLSSSGTGAARFRSDSIASKSRSIAS